ncbi:HMA2 domain-containing protein [Clostridium sp. WILCCON 0269]|uniref:HMA2 domain-containing protein n=1 Tax=Candidatus Clostridium eludens TaxID=3381663 RepID=A0ABW8SHJ1_9CLOT
MLNNAILKYILYSLAFFAVDGIINKNGSKNLGYENTYANIPSFKGVLEIRHYMPGRIRLYIPVLKENLEAKEVLMTQLSKIEFIEIKDINIFTGTILLNFNIKEMKPVLVIGIIIKLLGLEHSIDDNKESLIKKEIDNLKNSLNLAVYNKTNGVVDFDSVITLALLISGMKSCIKNSQVRPSGISYLWWAYSTIK